MSMKTSVLGYFQLVNPIQNLNLGQNITKLEVFSLFVFILFFFDGQHPQALA